MTYEMHYRLGVLLSVKPELSDALQCGLHKMNERSPKKNGRMKVQKNKIFNYYFVQKCFFVNELNAFITCINAKSFRRRWLGRMDGVRWAGLACQRPEFHTKRWV